MGSPREHPASRNSSTDGPSHEFRYTTRAASRFFFRPGRIGQEHADRESAEYLHGQGLSTNGARLLGRRGRASRYREGFVHKVYGSEQGIGAPDRPVNRRDKNVRKWYLSILRHGLYLLDALHLVRVVGRARRSRADVIIMDRYIYDELANLPLSNALTRFFVRMVMAFVPKPDVSYLLDADPEAARARKPEYPARLSSYLPQSVFLTRQMLVGGITVIPPLPLPDAKREVERAAADALAKKQRGFNPALDPAEAV